MSARSQGAGKAATSTQPGAPASLSGQARTLHSHPDQAGPTSTAQCHTNTQLSPRQLQPHPLHYPPSACRWQETAENEDFTALASSQESLDGRKML